MAAVNVWKHGHDGTNGLCSQTNGPFLSWRNSSKVTGNTSKKRANGRIPFRASLIGTSAGSVRRRMLVRGSKVRSSSKNVARDHPLPILCAGRRVPAPVPAIAKYLRLSEMRPYILARRSSSTLCLLKMPRSESHHQPSVPRPFRNRNRHPLTFLVYVSRERGVCSARLPTLCGLLLVCGCKRRSSGV